MTKVYEAENLSVFLNGVQVMGEARKRYDELAQQLSVVAAETCERAMKSWAEQAGVSVNALLAAGIYPVSSRVCSDDGRTVTIHVAPNVWKLPIREHDESEAEFIERARRMTW